MKESMFLFKCLSLLIGSDLFTQVIIGERGVDVKMRYDFITESILSGFGFKGYPFDAGVVFYFKDVCILMLD